MKFMGVLTLVCYFAALIFGLLWYLTYRQLAAERMLSMTRMEAEGYLTIPPPSAAEIKRLVTMRNTLEAQVEILEGRLAAQREEYQSLVQSVNKLKKELKELVVRKNANEQGEQLARTLTAMRPEDAAVAIATLDENILPDVIEYAFPYMDDKAFGKLMNAIATLDSQTNGSLAGKILEIIGTSLFSLDLKYQEDLDKLQISEDLREQFGNNGLLLSDKATLKVEKKGSRWLIVDDKQTYHIRKERGRLNVYLRTLS